MILEFDQMRVCLVVLGLVAQTIVADQSRIVPSNGNLLVSLNFMHLHLLSLVHTIPGQAFSFLSSSIPQLLVLGIIISDMALVYHLLF